MKKIFQILSIAVLTLGWSCNDDDFLNRPPTGQLSEDQIWTDEGQVLSVLGDLYNRYVDIATFKTIRIDNNDVPGWTTVGDFNEAFWSEAGRYNVFQNSGWDLKSWSHWDYAYIREMNLFIQKCTAADKLSPAVRERYLAEARFLRASYYFELVKRMGGVPLILEPMVYDYSGDPSYLQHPRAKESEIYDFVIKEAEEIKDKLPATPGEKSRATKAAALAMEVRAALYAGSIAKYGVNTPAVSLPGGEVGIPANMANGYYTKALAAAKEIITGKAGVYALYTKKPDLSENFASIFYDKANNSEVIFVEDFKLQSGKVHYFTGWNQPRYGAEEEEGGRINPSLQFVEAFEKLDNTFAPIPTTNANGTPIYYTDQTDIFAGRDARLAGTVILPGTTFKSRKVDIWAGYQLANGTVISGDDRGAQKTLPGKTVPEQVVGFDGPIDGFEFTAQTGFYLRKYLDPVLGSGQRGVNSEVWLVRYRYAEVLLNAAEAAFELGQAAEAAGYMNQVRERAGLVKPLKGSDINFDRIVHERRVELAFEGHVLYDMKRWRIAHQIMDGNAITAAEVSKDLGKATKRNTQPWGLWSYKIYDPGSANNGKWIFKPVKLSRVTGSDRFQLGNYYSYIDDAIISNNPKLVRNPNQ
ncbi:RagB/SusD family nutrient uptake outer membrane protein [Dyadobacter fermentans]|uniref:RagB/SusD domain protein n=1 Tax=Dyadobacter fermentans (strain ATCC 700827 / DSM 18053 / CIP 107007 / KCTC 52180 / NS114) TaxID=471854 RepID=C6W4S3_DYAFD|nr:RagB/SusD family nutrient uptake outer membrane protein [Dyadobacter fermentans]ACT95897.1 RagB/SusD domain protein [Dyadobacter fermentans DSM 18053]